MPVEYLRGGNEASPILDHIRIEQSDKGLSARDRLAIVRTITERVGQPIDAAILTSESHTLENADALYRSTVLRLEAAFADQINKITSWTVEQSDALQKQKLQLAEELNVEKAQLHSETDRVRARLKSFEEDLNQRKKDMDDRDYMHARRATRADIQKIITDRQKQFSLTSGTQKLRRPIHAALIALVAALLLLNIVQFTELTRMDWKTSSYVLAWGLLKQGALALALLGGLYYYVRWMNRWFEQHSAAEFQLKQFQLDVDRASWVVESALEWRRVAKEELPPPLLEGITRNLFTQAALDDNKASAADELASAIMGSAAGIKLKVGENEVNISRQGIKKLGKTPVE